MRVTGYAVVLMIGWAWGGQPPAAAFPFPSRAPVAARPDTDPPADPAAFYDRLRAEPSAARLREYLSYLPPGSDGHPLSTRVSFAATVRRVAVEELARRKDRESFAAILTMVEKDPSVRVRTAAAAALSEYADDRAVPALVQALGQKDEGFSAEGHVDGDLRRTAVRALGRIGTADALAALFDGLRGGPAKAHCAEFWFGTRDPRHLAAFLKLHDAGPVPPDLAAGVIEGLLRATRGERLMTPDEQARAEAAFLAGVADPDRFGPAADLSEKGRYVVQTAYTFYPGGFVRVDFAFRDPNPRGFGHGYGVLYRKAGARWRPVGRVGGWVE